MGQIFIAALKEETPNLKDFHYSGVGKINATIKIMELISKFQPNEIINYGTAGSTKPVSYTHLTLPTNREV